MSDTAVLDRLDTIETKLDALTQRLGGYRISAEELGRKTGYTTHAIYNFIKNGVIPVQRTEGFGERGKTTTIDIETASKFMLRPETKRQIAKMQREARNAEH